MYCSSKHCTAVYCPATCTAVYCPAICITMYCPAQYCTAVYCPTICTAMYRPAQYCTAVYCARSLLQCTAQCCTAHLSHTVACPVSNSLQQWQVLPCCQGVILDLGLLIEIHSTANEKTVSNNRLQITKGLGAPVTHKDPNLAPTAHLRSLFSNITCTLNNTLSKERWVQLHPLSYYLGVPLHGANSRELSAKE